MGSNPPTRPRSCPALLRRFSPLFLFLIFAACPVVSAHAQVAHAASAAFDEYLVKGAFLMNFPKFVEWPAEALPVSQQTFVIGIIGMNPFAGNIEELADANQVQGRRVTIRRFKRIEDLQGCHLLYISVSERKNLSRILGAVKGKNILTVSDLKGFADAGGMIGMVIADNRVLFEVNETRARQEKLRVSVQLLKLAKRVVTDRK